VGDRKKFGVPPGGGKKQTENHVIPKGRKHEKKNRFQPLKGFWEVQRERSPPISTITHKKRAGRNGHGESELVTMVKEFFSLKELPGFYQQSIKRDKFLEKKFTVTAARRGHCRQKPSFWEKVFPQKGMTEGS